MFRSDLLRIARNANLPEYLMRNNIPILKSGKRYRHKHHDSLVFLGGYYVWNSRGEMGNAIDYLTRHMGMDFDTAVKELVPFATSCDTPAHNSRVIAYLCKTRAVEYSIVSQLLESGHLLQDSRNNAVFFHL